MPDVTAATLIPAASPDQDLRLLIAGFLAGYGPSTRKTYAWIMKKWVVWCHERDLDVIQVRRVHIDLFARWMEEETKFAPATVCHHLCVLRSFYLYLEDENVIVQSPARRVRLPKHSQESSTQGLSREELIRFIAVSTYNPTYHAMVCMLALNGMRISEVVGAQIEHMSVERGHRTVRVIRKGSKHQTLPLSPKTARAIDAILGERTSGPILLTKDGTPMTRINAYKAVQRLGKKAGIDTNMHPHRLRHAFVTTALDAGVPLADVQDSVGHADPRQTQRYNRNRFSLDRNATHIVTAFLAGG